MININVDAVVRCIDATDSNYLELGELYKVKSICYGGTHVELCPVYGYVGGCSTYLVSRFEEVKSES